MSERGTFIVLEGGEGSGKTAIAEQLRKELPDTIFTRDPGGTALGEKIRPLLMAKDAPMNARTELLLFLSARAQLVAEVIESALQSGKNVISARFALSTIAYQIYGRQKPEYLPLVRQAHEIILEKAVPDACILLDVTPAKGLERVRSRPGETTRFDEEELAFHERVREGYKKHAGEFGRAFIVDSDRSLEEVWKEVLGIVQSLI